MTKKTRNQHKVKHALLTVAALCALGSAPTTALANGFITPGNGWVEANPGAEIKKDNMLGVRLDKDRSYACTVLGYTIDLASTIQDPDSVDVPVNLRGDVTPMVSTPEEDDNNRITYIAQKSGMHYLKVADAQASGDDGVSASCKETTLYGDYNTNVNDFNFLELKNITNAPITGHVTAINYDGVKAIDKQPFTVAPNRRMDISVHDAVGPAKFGLVIVAHDGPWGALQGAVSQYYGDVTDFKLSVANPLRPRDQ